MSELFPSHPIHEQQRQEAMQPFNAYELHNQQIDVSLSGHPLVPQADAVKTYGVNGDIIATVTFPGSDTEPAKEVAVVDYGEPDPANLKPVFVFEGSPIPLFGKAKERYGLKGLNYTPESHMATHVDFPEGHAITLGRNIGDRSTNQDANYKLGLITQEVGNEFISSKHATITIANGKLTIADHSTNGSLVRVHNPETTVSREQEEALYENLGQNALNGNGIDMPPMDGMRRVTVVDPEGKVPNKHYWTK